MKSPEYQGLWVQFLQNRLVACETKLNHLITITVTGCIAITGLFITLLYNTPDEKIRWLMIVFFISGVGNILYEVTLKFKDYYEQKELIIKSIKRALKEIQPDTNIDKYF